MKILAAALVVSLLLVALAPPARQEAAGQTLASACPKTVAISATANTQLVTSVANKFIGICAFVLVAAVAEIVNLVEGIGTTCATEPHAVIGSTTAANGLSLAANGGVAMTSPFPFARTQYDDKNLCLTKDGSDRVSGFLSYVLL